MKTTISTLAAASVLAMAAPAQADGQFGHGYPAARPAVVAPSPLAGLRDIDIRLANQRTRIDTGFRRGAITRGEFQRLMAEHHDIRTMRRAFVADGFLSPRERVELNRRLDMASAHIRFEARDFQRRF
jgi:hypothetical protein